MPARRAPLPTSVLTPEERQLQKLREMLAKAEAEAERVGIVTLRCAHCGKVGPAEKDFGRRVRADGKADFHSWCRACRGTVCAHLKRIGEPSNYKCEHGRERKGGQWVPLKSSH